MNLEIDFRSGIPIYLQVVDRIKEMIADGRLKPGNQLPTVRALALEMRVNFNTVARAYRLLDEVGLISTQRGRGTYIWEEPTEETMKQLKQKSLEELARSFLNGISQLGYSLEDAIEELKRTQLTGPQTSRENTIEMEDKGTVRKI